jgi:hypothetical protein
LAPILQAKKPSHHSNLEFPAFNTRNASLAFIYLIPQHLLQNHHQAPTNTMCLTVKYLCPCCGEESGKSDTWSRRHDPCVEHLFFTRVMKAEHFKDWFCATEGCEYSKEKQEGWDSGIHSVVETQHPPNPLRDGEAVSANNRKCNLARQSLVRPPC